MQGRSSSQVPCIPGSVPGRSQLNCTAHVATAHPNPYLQFQYPQAPHYAQAYARLRPPGFRPPGVTAEGFTLSSTYVPGPHYAIVSQLPGVHQQSSHSAPHHGPSQAHWYQPGNSRCTKQGCPFTGSKKSVEIHMMDRHLIYPPEWEKRKKKDDWDADPSLKGKPIPIQGTTINLDTPEAIEAWIAERKRRFPTAARVEDKKKKLEDAIARGQLQLQDVRFPNKKRRLDNNPREEQYSDGQHARGRGRGRGRGRSRGRGSTDRGWQSHSGVDATLDHRIPHPLPHRPPSSSAVASPVAPEVLAVQKANPQLLTYDSDDGAPEVLSSRAAPPDVLVVDGPVDQNSKETANVEEPAVRIEPPAMHLAKGPHAKQPRKPMHNPFAARTSLLRTLLTPEIRMTVSNLSQAIRFLVDNDFLENVELKPGQASEKMIEVIGSSGHAQELQDDSTNV